MQIVIIYAAGASINVFNATALAVGQISVKQSGLIGLSSNSLLCICGLIAHDTVSTFLGAVLVAINGWVWWNGGGGDDTKRRLRRLGESFKGVRRTAPTHA